jgi:hypothetical protein
MNKLQQKLMKEIEKQEGKGAAQHRVEGYRQTDSAAALLQAARGRQKWACDWRRRAIASGADSVRYVTASMAPKFTTRAAIFSKDGVDVLLLSPSRENWLKLDADDLAGTTGEEELKRQYFKVYNRA